MDDYQDIVAFQVPILNILVNDVDVYDAYVNDLKVSDFTLPECQLIYESLRTYRSKCPKGVPKSHELAMALYTTRAAPDAEHTATPEHTPVVGRTLQHIYSGVETAEYFVQALPDYVRKVRFIELTQQQSYLNHDEYMRRMTALHELTVGPGEVKENQIHDPWSDDLVLFDPSASRQAAVPTGMHKLDTNLSGGLVPGEMGLVTASSGVGKTNSLLNFASAAATRGYQALIFSFEIDEFTMARRYQAMNANVPFRLLNIPINQWPPELKRYRDQLMHVRQTFRSHTVDGVPPVQIIAMTDKRMTSKQIREHVLRWQDRVMNAMPHGQPLAVYVDWLEYVDTIPGMIKTKNPEKHELLGDVAKQMRMFIAQECGVALWSAHQANRGAANKTSLTMADIGKSYSINEPLDINLGLTAPDDRDLQDQMGREEKEGDIEHALQRVRRRLHANSMKNRKSVPIAFDLCQSETLKFWKNDRECNEVEQELINGNWERL